MDEQALLVIAELIENPPSQVRATLAVIEDCLLNKLAKLADKILDRETSLQVATIALLVEKNTSNLADLERRIATLVTCLNLLSKSRKISFTVEL